MQNSSINSPDRQKYSLLLKIGLCLLVVSVAYRDTVIGLVTVWLQFDESMSHGFLVLLACIYMGHTSQVMNAYRSARPELYAAIPLLLIGICWGIADIVDINIFQQLLLPLLFLSCIQLLAGSEITKRLFVPVLFVYFAIPVWDYLNDYLLILASFVVEKGVRMSGITAFIEGNSIFLPSGEIVIAAGCSGLRYLIVAMFLSSLSGYLYFKSPSFRAALVLGCIALALLANWVRIYAIILIADATSMQSKIIGDHETLGWILFLIFMLPLFYLNYTYGQDRVIFKQNSTQSEQNTEQWKNILSLLLLLTLVWTGPVFSNMIIENSIYQKEKILLDNLQSNNWKFLSNEAEMLWSPGFPVSDDSIHRIFTDGEDMIELAIFPYYKKEKDGEILPYIGSIYDPALWSLNQSLTFITTNDGVELAKNYLINKYSQEKMIVVSQYNIGGYTTIQNNLAKLYQIPAILSQSAFAILTVAAIKCGLECDEADEKLNVFLDDVLVNMSHIK